MTRWQPAKRTLALTIAAALMAFAMTGCALQDQPDDGTTAEEEATIEEYRQALVSEEDLKMEYKEDSEMSTASGALGAKRSGMGLLTADIVISTSVALVHHARVIHAVTHLPPTRVSKDRAVWEGTDDGLFLRLGIDRKQVPKGYRYRYRVKARPQGKKNAKLRTIFGGWVVRMGPKGHHHGKPGFGVARYHFDNFDKLRPNKKFSGKVRVAFRRAGGVHQVVVKAIDAATPEDPDFPPLAKYSYTLLPNTAGSLRWFSKGDFNKDNKKPLENVAMHARWRSDKSGVAAGVAMDGTLKHDYLSVAECWNGRLFKTYGFLGWPKGQTEEGKRGACTRNPDKLSAPKFKSNMQNTDPSVPKKHPKEKTL